MDVCKVLAVCTLRRNKTVITVRASQKIFTHEEVVNLTGICVEHLHNFVKRHRLGFIARAAQAAETQVDQLFFTPWDLTLLVTLFPRCTH
jgi:hypothetical protein